MDHVKNALWVLAVLCVAAAAAHADTYYEKSTIKSPNSLSQTFDVMSYGAKCDTSTDDTTAIAATIAAAKTFYSAASLNTIKILFPPKGQCYVSALLNFTGFTNTNNHVVVEGQGAWIHWTNTGNALIDAMGSVNISWNNLSLQGNATYNGIQIGRTVSTTTPSGLQEFDNVFVAGAFGDGACYSYAAEQVLWKFVTCSNTSIVGGFGLIMDGSNHWNVPTVASGGQQVTADTATSFLQNTFIQGQFKSQAGGIGGGIWMGNAQQVRFDNSYCYILATAGPTYGSCIWLYETAPTASDFGLKDAVFDVHSEPLMANTFLITGPGSGAAFTATPIIRGLKLKDAYLFAATDIFATAAASNITTVSLQGSTVEVLGGPAAPTFGTFDTPANYTFHGRFISYAATRWNGVSYTGNYYVEQAGVAKSYIGGEFSGLSLVSGSSVQAAATSKFNWSTRGILTSPAAAAVQLGDTNNSTPTNQTLSTEGAVGGVSSNVAGANLTVQSGLGTGNATGSTMTLQTPVVGSSGTTAETALNALVLGATAISLGNATSNPTFTFLGSGAISGTPVTSLFASPPALGGTAPAAGAFTTVSATGAITSTLATGTAPFTVASTTNVANLNASLLNGTTFASPAAIGSGTPAAGTFTTLTANGVTNINASNNAATNIGTGSTTSTTTIGQNTATPGAVAILGPVSFQAGTAYSGASWSATSPVYNHAAITLNDTTASGTVTTDAAYTFQAPTFTSTGGASTTITNAVVLNLPAPLCTGGVVCTNLTSLSAAGKIVGTAGITLSGATLNFNVSSSAAINIGTGTDNALITIGGGSNGIVMNAGLATGYVKNTGFISVGTKFTATGTGACGTITTTLGGAAAGSMLCTGTAGASTITITINGATGLASPTGWACSASDVTSGVVWSQSGAASTTTATIGGAIATTSDRVVFSCMGY